MWFGVWNELIQVNGQQRYIFLYSNSPPAVRHWDTTSKMLLCRVKRVRAEKIQEIPNQIPSLYKSGNEYGLWESKSDTSCRL